MSSWRNILSSRTKNGDRFFTASGTATSATVPFAALAYSRIRYRLWANIPGFNAGNITLTNMTANTYDNTYTLQTAGASISPLYTAAQGGFTVSLGDQGPTVWTGVLWLPAAPALKTLTEAVWWTRNALWKMDSKCSDNGHEPTAAVFSWVSNVAYTLDVYGYT